MWAIYRNIYSRFMKHNKSGQAAGREVHRLKNRHNGRDYKRMPLFLVITGIVMVLAGCGQDDAITADTQVQDTISDTADMSTGDVADSSDMTEDAAGGDNASVQPSVEPEQRNAVEEALGIDEETRQQLMTELLEEGELDVSVVESGRATKGCTFDLPEGFVESAETDNLYVTERYPLDTSMIYYDVMDGDISLQLMTKDFFKEQAEESLSQAYDEDIVINIDGYESVKIDGHPAFRILCHYEVDNIKITQLEYIINADKTYVITYSQTSDYDWMEAFETSAATIHVK